jgi:hypothetical protein
MYGIGPDWIGLNWIGSGH